MVWQDERAIREAVAASSTYSETLKRLELRAAGGNFKQLKRYIERYGISTAHFDANRARRDAALKRGKVPLAEVLVESSSFRRSHLKERLFAEGLKARICEMCGQGEEWRGVRMALILDHVNGVANDPDSRTYGSCARTAMRRFRRTAVAMPG